jgi:hypothetical protein
VRCGFPFFVDFLEIQTHRADRQVKSVYEILDAGPNFVEIIYAEIDFIRID